MTDGPEQRELGPEAKKMEERWKRIVQGVSDGISVQYQVREAGEFAEMLRQVDRQALTSSEAADIADAIFIHEWGVDSDLPLAINERRAILEYCREQGNRISTAGEDLLKFGVKTLMISHGAVIIAVIGSLFQAESHSLSELLEYAMFFSVIGLALASIGLVRLTYFFSNMGARMIAFSAGTSTNSEIRTFFDDGAKNRLRNFFKNDIFLYSSLLILIFEGLWASCVLLASNPAST